MQGYNQYSNQQQNQYYQNSGQGGGQQLYNHHPQAHNQSWGNNPQNGYYNQQGQLNRGNGQPPPQQHYAYPQNGGNNQQGGYNGYQNQQRRQDVYQPNQGGYGYQNQQQAPQQSQGNAQGASQQAGGVQQPQYYQNSQNQVQTPRGYQPRQHDVTTPGIGQSEQKSTHPPRSDAPNQIQNPSSKHSINAGRSVNQPQNNQYYYQGGAGGHSQAGVPAPGYQNVQNGQNVHNPQNVVINNGRGQQYANGARNPQTGQEQPPGGAQNAQQAPYYQNDGYQRAGYQQPHQGYGAQGDGQWAAQQPQGPQNIPQHGQNGYNNGYYGNNPNQGGYRQDGAPMNTNTAQPSNLNNQAAGATFQKSGNVNTVNSTNQANTGLAQVPQGIQPQQKQADPINKPPNIVGNKNNMNNANVGNNVQPQAQTQLQQQNQGQQQPQQGGVGRGGGNGAYQAGGVAQGQNQQKIQVQQQNQTKAVQPPQQAPQQQQPQQIQQQPQQPTHNNSGNYGYQQQQNQQGNANMGTRYQMNNNNTANNTQNNQQTTVNKNNKTSNNQQQQQAQQNQIPVNNNPKNNNNVPNNQAPQPQQPQTQQQQQTSVYQNHQQQVAQNMNNNANPAQMTQQQQQPMQPQQGYYGQQQVMNPMGYPAHQYHQAAAYQQQVGQMAAYGLHQQPQQMYQGYPAVGIPQYGQQPHQAQAYPNQVPAATDPAENYQKGIYKDTYDQFDPNKPRTPNHELEKMDDAYRFNLDLQKLHELGMKKVSLKYRKGSKRDKMRKAQEGSQSEITEELKEGGEEGSQAAETPLNDNKGETDLEGGEGIAGQNLAEDDAAGSKTDPKTEKKAKNGENDKKGQEKNSSKKEQTDPDLESEIKTKLMLSPVVKKGFDLFGQLGSLPLTPSAATGQDQGKDKISLFQKTKIRMPLKPITENQEKKEGGDAEAALPDPEVIMDSLKIFGNLVEKSVQTDGNSSVYSEKSQPKISNLSAVSVEVLGETGANNEKEQADEAQEEYESEPEDEDDDSALDEADQKVSEGENGEEEGKIENEKIEVGAGDEGENKVNEEELVQGEAQEPAEPVISKRLNFEATNIQGLDNSSKPVNNGDFELKPAANLPQQAPKEVQNQPQIEEKTQEVANPNPTQTPQKPPRVDFQDQGVPILESPIKQLANQNDGAILPQPIADPNVAEVQASGGVLPTWEATQPHHQVNMGRVAPQNLTNNPQQVNNTNFAANQNNNIGYQNQAYQAPAHHPATGYPINGNSTNVGYQVPSQQPNLGPAVVSNAQAPVQPIQYPQQPQQTPLPLQQPPTTQPAQPQQQQAPPQAPNFGAGQKAGTQQAEQFKNDITTPAVATTNKNNNIINNTISNNTNVNNINGNNNNNNTTAINNNNTTNQNGVVNPPNNVSNTNNNVNNGNQGGYQPPVEQHQPQQQPAQYPAYQAKQYPQAQINYENKAVNNNNNPNPANNLDSQNNAQNQPNPATQGNNNNRGGYPTAQQPTNTNNNNQPPVNAPNNNNPQNYAPNDPNNPNLPPNNNNNNQHYNNNAPYQYHSNNYNYDGYNNQNQYYDHQAGQPQNQPPQYQGYRQPNPNPQNQYPPNNRGAPDASPGYQQGQPPQNYPPQHQGPHQDPRYPHQDPRYPHPAPANPVDNRAPQQPIMTEEEKEELIELYPYMRSQPLHVIEEFWQNINKLSDKMDDFSLAPEDIRMLEERQMQFDESRNSDIIKQELRRKRKRPRKKKKKKREAKDYNMIDSISEFSRETDRNIQLKSEVLEKNLSRSSSIASLHKSMPQDIKARASKKSRQALSAFNSRNQSPEVNRGQKTAQNDFSERKAYQQGVDVRGPERAEGAFNINPRATRAHIYGPQQLQNQNSGQRNQVNQVKNFELPEFKPDHEAAQGAYGNHTNPQGRLQHPQDGINRREPRRGGNGFPAPKNGQNPPPMNQPRYRDPAGVGYTQPEYDQHLQHPQYYQRGDYPQNAQNPKNGNNGPTNANNGNNGAPYHYDAQNRYHQAPRNDQNPPNDPYQQTGYDQGNQGYQQPYNNPDYNQYNNGGGYYQNDGQNPQNQYNRDYGYNNGQNQHYDYYGYNRGPVEPRYGPQQPGGQGYDNRPSQNQIGGFDETGANGNPRDRYQGWNDGQQVQGTAPNQLQYPQNENQGYNPNMGQNAVGAVQGDVNAPGVAQAVPPQPVMAPVAPQQPQVAPQAENRVMGQQPLNPQQNPEKEAVAAPEDSKKIPVARASLLDQCRHKNLTGKLQRRLREMSDNERLEVFRILKPNFLEVCCDPYGKYVATLFLGFSKTQFFAFFSNPKFPLLSQIGAFLAIW